LALIAIHRGINTRSKPTKTNSSAYDPNPSAELTSFDANAHATEKYRIIKSQHSILSKARGIKGFALFPVLRALVSWIWRMIKPINMITEHTIRMGTSDQSAVIVKGTYEELPILGSLFEMM
jgi:hypothetical protein